MPVSRGDRQAMLIMPTYLDPPTELVRDWIGTSLTCVPDLVRGRAALITAELVDNARWYGCGPYVLHLSLHHAQRTLTIAVEDGSPGLGAGWTDRVGLMLVAGLSERWGVEDVEQGKAVWAELSLVPSGSTADEEEIPR